RRRAHALGHEALEIGIDRTVLRGHGVPAWLRAPRRLGGFIGKQGAFERSLNGVENTRFVGGQVAGEVAQERLLAQPAIVPDQTMPAEAGGAGNRPASAV